MSGEKYLRVDVSGIQDSTQYVASGKRANLLRWSPDQHQFGEMHMRGFLRFVIGIGVCLLVGLLFARAARAEVGVVVMLPSQTLQVMVDGTTVHTWPISSGRTKHTTYPGTYIIRRESQLRVMYHSHKYKIKGHLAPMPYAIFFDPAYGIAIHGTHSMSKLGSPDSHGCIHLSMANAKTLFRLVKKEVDSHKEVTIKIQ